MGRNIYYNDSGLSYISLTYRFSGKNPDKYKELVGKNLRNKNITYYKEVEEELKKRGRCETFHSQIKAVFKFDVKYLRKESRADYVKLDLIAAQIMFLAYLQNDCLSQHFVGFV